MLWGNIPIALPPLGEAAPRVPLAMGAARGWDGCSAPSAHRVCVPEAGGGVAVPPGSELTGEDVLPPPCITNVTYVTS